MPKYNIDEILHFLSWKNCKEIQQKGMEEASKIKNLSVFIMPIEDKSIWENCAKVLFSKTDSELKLYFFELFHWLMDMNWPGADIIYDRLIYVSDPQIIAAYRFNLDAAVKMQDFVWEQSLRNFYMNYVMNLIRKDRSMEDQKRGIHLAKDIKNLKIFLRPRFSDQYLKTWENCAIILSSRSDEEISPYLINLFEWLQNLNWPGAGCIRNRIQKYKDKISYDFAFHRCLERAKESQDQVWLENLKKVYQEKYKN